MDDIIESSGYKGTSLTVCNAFKILLNMLSLGLFGPFKLVCNAQGGNA